MAATSTPTTLELTKKVYGDLQSLKPDNDDYLVKKIPFAPDQEQLGDQFIFPVQMTFEHGDSFNGTDGGEITLADPVAQEVKKASVDAYERIMRTRITNRTMQDALKKGPQAFESATRVKLEGLMMAAEMRRALSLRYGQRGLGVVSGISSGVITITDATWSAATWDGMENAVLEAFDGTGATATQHNGDLTVTAVDPDNKQITVSGTSAAVAANDILFFKGARTATSNSKEMPGLRVLCAHNSGTLHGLSATTYSRWKANTKTITTATMANYLSGLSKIAGRRVGRKKTNLLVPPAAYERLNSDLMTARRFDGSYSKQKAEQGFEFISFYGVTGETEIIPDPLIRDGDSFAFTEKNGVRVGSGDLRWLSPPGSGDQDLWFWLQDKNTYEARVGAIQGPVFRRPYETVYFSGLTYS